jgi:hypothetical protein
MNLANFTSWLDELLEDASLAFETSTTRIVHEVIKLSAALLLETELTIGRAAYN